MNFRLRGLWPRVRRRLPCPRPIHGYHGYSGNVQLSINKIRHSFELPCPWNWEIARGILIAPHKAQNNAVSGRYIYDFIMLNSQCWVFRDQAILNRLVSFQVKRNICEFTVTQPTLIFGPHPKGFYCTFNNNSLSISHFHVQTMFSTCMGSYLWQ